MVDREEDERERARRRAREEQAESSGEFELPEGFTADEETVVLVRRAKGGDAAALNELFARYLATIERRAAHELGPRLRAKEEPEDLAQTTFRTATRDFKGYEYRGKGSLLRWLIRILQNKVRDKADFHSAGKRDTARETELDAPSDASADSGRSFEPADEGTSVSLRVAREEELEVLRAALEELSPDHKQAITLVFFEQMTYRQADEVMGGRDENALRMLLRRAEDKLHEILARRLRN